MSKDTGNNSSGITPLASRSISAPAQIMNSWAARLRESAEQDRRQAAEKTKQQQEKFEEAYRNHREHFISLGLDPKPKDEFREIYDKELEKALEKECKKHPRINNDRGPDRGAGGGAAAPAC